ncbi:MULTISPECIES: hypothetical protein [unclassified Frondihabitans]|uniref:hypothetical protein n=1 Tax=unclassified Frondihabitans TaxID=2626248 RepID=UPI000F50D3C0|nr:MULTISPECIES: hypothetical protein [unclassified Frondihabitans]
MQPASVVLAFVASGAGATLVVALVRGIYMARQEGRPRRRIQAIREAVETAGLLPNESEAARVIWLHVDEEAAALKKRYPDPLSPTEGDKNSLKYEAGFVISLLGVVATVLFLLQVWAPPVWSWLTTGPQGIAAIVGGLVGIAAQVVVSVKSRRVTVTRPPERAGNQDTAVAEGSGAEFDDSDPHTTTGQPAGAADD